MDQLEISTLADTVATVPSYTDISRDPAPTPDPTPPYVAPTVLRHHFTLTVEQVSAELYLQGFSRDDRTIQRWCKAGKLSAIVDEIHGDRYLIDPSSLRDILTKLTVERDSRTARPFLPSQPVEHVASAPRPSFGAAPTYGHSTQASSHDRHSDIASTQSRHAASEGDETEALKQRIAELERTNAMLTVDKQVREQMVDYMKEQFNQMMDHALERSQEVGQLRAENGFLKAQLPSGREGQGTASSAASLFTPKRIFEQQDPPMHSPSGWSEN